MRPSFCSPFLQAGSDEGFCRLATLQGEVPFNQQLNIVGDAGCEFREQRVNGQLR